MKLLSKYNRANIITAVIILLASSITYYFIIRVILIQQLDKDLKVEEQEIAEYVTEHNALPNESEYKGQEIKFEKLGSEHIIREIKSGTIYNITEKEMQPIRTLTFPFTFHNESYKGIVIKSQVEAEDLLQFIVLVTGAIFILLLAVIFLVNRFILNKLWQPFYDTLERLKSFNLKTSGTPNFPQTNIQEFNELNTSVDEMMQRIRNEFEVLKQFTENASHEMQTPVAIINSKLDLLLQTSNEKQVPYIEGIYEATSRLVRLNQTLLLLTKIENSQFNTKEKVNIKTLVEQKIQQFDELNKARTIKCSAYLEDAFVNINKELADIMLNNLFSNAVKHNYVGGYIYCDLRPSYFSITNSGLPLTINEKYLFERFQKSDHSEGTGLGLAVVSQICESSGMTVEYTSANNKHTFKLLFPQ